MYLYSGGQEFWRYLKLYSQVHNVLIQHYMQIVRDLNISVLNFACTIH